MSTLNVYAFIDSQNLNLGIQSQGWKLDWRKFRKYLRDKYHVSKAYLFIGYIYQNKHLYQNLKNYGYILIFKPTLVKVNRGKMKIKGNSVWKNIWRKEKNYSRYLHLQNDILVY